MIDERERLLEKTTKELEDLREEFNEFAYIVSHDLSAPFRQIEGFSKIIASRNADTFDEKTKRHFDLVIGGATNGKEILAALLEYSRLNTNTEPLTSVDSNNSIADAIQSLATLIKDSSARIIYSDLPVIVGDRQQVNLVFYHLLKNALLFQDKGQIPVISIESKELEDHWQFCVKDNGIGIEAKLTGRIFKILRRGVSDDEHPGTGMGLALAEKILKRHNGKIWVETEKGKGSAFYFSIAKKPR